MATARMIALIGFQAAVCSSTSGYLRGADPWLVGPWSDGGCQPPLRMLGAQVARPGGVLLACWA